MTPKQILVLLGTDRHPFDRLVTWADARAASDPDTRVLVQFGYTKAPTQAKGASFLAPDELRRTVTDADVVITHGGPGTITDARMCGKQPIVVPRDPARGEHVDGHQMRFAAWIAEKDLASVASDCSELDRMVDQELLSPAHVNTPAVPGRGAPERLASLLVAGGRPSATGPVLYIAGAGRSGSTILERILGQDPRVVTLGEVHHLWERGIARNELCGCGKPFHDCDFWVAVGDHAFGGWDQVDLGRVRELANRVDRQRRVIKTAAPWMTPSMTRATEEYTEHHRRIYRAALAISGAEVVVDSTKHPSLALALSHSPRIDLRILHLVRDSLGVTYSWSKTVSRPEARSTGDAEMARYTASRSSVLWTATNVEAELLRGRRKAYARLRYEDFVQAPQQEIDRLWRRLGLPGQAPQPVGDDGSLTLSPTHTVAGNPARFAKGVTRLRSDAEWTTKMRRADRWQVAMLTAPMRALYGYRGVG